MRYSFACAEHEEFGNKGWKQTDKLGFDPLSGMAVAHDILEHFSQGTDSPADEIQALGASFVVRGEDYYSQKNKCYTSPAIYAASEMGEIVSHIIYENMYLPEPPRYRKSTDEFGGWISEFLEESKNNLKEQFEEESQLKINEILRKSEGWLYRGIRRAKQRYKNREVLYLFCGIEEQSDKLLKYAEIGDIMTVYVSRDRVECKIKNGWDY